jgi:hypothetical protein
MYLCVNWVYWSFEAEGVDYSVKDSHAYAVHGGIYEFGRFNFWHRTMLREVLDRGYFPKASWTTFLMYAGNRLLVTSMAEGSVSIASVSQE